MIILYFHFYYLYNLERLHQPIINYGKLSSNCQRNIAQPTSARILYWLQFILLSIKVSISLEDWQLHLLEVHSVSSGWDASNMFQCPIKHWQACFANICRHNQWLVVVQPFYLCSTCLRACGIATETKTVNLAQSNASKKHGNIIPYIFADGKVILANLNNTVAATILLLYKLATVVPTSANTTTQTFSKRNCLSPHQAWLETSTWGWLLGSSWLMSELKISKTGAGGKSNLSI